MSNRKVFNQRRRANLNEKKNENNFKIAKKMKALSKVAGPLVMLASVLFFEDEEAVRYEILRLRIFKTQNDITIQTCGSHE